MPTESVTIDVFNTPSIKEELQYTSTAILKSSLDEYGDFITSKRFFEIQQYLIVKNENQKKLDVSTWDCNIKSR